MFVIGCMESVPVDLPKQETQYYEVSFFGSFGLSKKPTLALGWVGEDISPLSGGSWAVGLSSHRSQPQVWQTSWASMQMGGHATVNQKIALGNTPYFFAI